LKFAAHVGNNWRLIKVVARAQAALRFSTIPEKIHRICDQNGNGVSGNGGQKWSKVAIID
jgi:hypothetical protein